MKKTIPFLSIILTNLILIFGFYYWGWDLIEFIFMYVLESLFLLISYTLLTFCKKLPLNESLHLINVHMKRKVFILLMFFSLIVHILFAIIFYNVTKETTPVTQILTGALPPFLIIIANYFLTVIYEYLNKNQGKMIDPQNIYKRMFVLHFLLFFGVITFHFSQSIQFTLLCIISIKSLFELNLQNLKHQKSLNLLSTRN